MSIDLNTLSARELETLIAQAKKRKTTLKKRKPLAAVRARIAGIIKTEGYTIEELFGPGTPRAVRTPRAASGTKKATKARTLGKVAAKYHNPENTSETWSGRGKQPRWLAAKVAEGKSVADFLINK